MTIMPHYKYGFKGYESPELAKAQQYNIDASYKDLCAVCSNIHGMDAMIATTYLEKAARQEIPVEYRRWAKHLGHRRELGGRRGRYPQKAARYVLQVLKNAIANANAKGLIAPAVIHASANKQMVYPRMQPKGRRVRSNYVTARVEIILKSSSEKVRPAGPEVKKEAKVEKKQVAKEAKVESAVKREEAKKEITGNKQVKK